MLNVDMFFYLDCGDGLIYTMQVYMHIYKLIKLYILNVSFLVSHLYLKNAVLKKNQGNKNFPHDKKNEVKRLVINWKKC